MLTWPAGPAVTCTLPVEWTNRSTTRLPLIGKTLVPAGWRGAVVGAGLVNTMSAMASSTAAARISRPGRRQADGIRAASEASELDDALLRTVAMAAEMPASMRRLIGFRCSRRRASHTLRQVNIHWAGQLVGVPEPTAIAKTCISVCPNEPGREGSVTDATVWPAWSGTEAK
jgi:hypothetical protein